MASKKELLEYLLDQLSDLPGITYRKMMGEYLLYIDGKLFGGLYDDRLLVKPVKAARALLPDAPLASPYEGAKELLQITDIDDRTRLKELITAMAEELPPPKRT